MTLDEYSKVALDHPELKLPAAGLLNEEFISRLAGMTADELISRRTSALLSRDHRDVPLTILQPDSDIKYV